MRRLIRLLSALAVLHAAMPAVAQDLPRELRGKPKVIDGDRLMLGEEKVRLFGIDAPEAGLDCPSADGGRRPCGDMAAEVLKQAVGEREVWCVPRERDRYGRLVSVCLAGKVELNGLMVREGWAVARLRNSEHYVVAEAEARRERRGMWAGEFAPPAEWQRQQR